MSEGKGVLAGRSLLAFAWADSARRVDWCPWVLDEVGMDEILMNSAGVGRFVNLQ